MSSTINQVIHDAVLTTADDLRELMASVPTWVLTAGDLGVREFDLQRALCNALQTRLGEVAAVEGRLPAGVSARWSGRLGRVDVVARLADSSELYFETKLCARDTLHEALWDLLKLALVTTVQAKATAYLVYAAPVSRWGQEQHPTSVFETGSIDVRALLCEQYPNAWGWCIAPVKARPVSVPSTIRIERVAHATMSVGDREWQLRCALVEANSSDGWVAFTDGWPGSSQRP